ncbi:MAG: CocE/NonD family hydrolase [Actinobacteria bacterium]|nr:MAG: CocE/NonD family hydrolase [Actinomycetota bacterium]
MVLPTQGGMIMNWRGTSLSRTLCGLATLLLALMLVAGCGGTAEPEKVSMPGEYSGYSEPVYTSWETTSQYVPMRDGTKIAVDVYQPAGGPQEKLPAVLIMTPYHRASVEDGEVVDLMTNPESPYRTIVSYGYAIVCADIRGTGASYGTRFGIFSPIEVQDGSDLVDWIAAQDWCDGNVGMMGQSYLAIIQFMNASNMNPHLKCIIPRYSANDLYDFVYPGGILDFNFVEVYDLAMKLLNGNKTAAPVDIYPSKPVDEDTGGSMLAAATQEHEANTDLVVLADQMTFRDSVVDTPWGMPMGYPTASPSGHLEEIEESGVAIYNMGGWLDCYSADTLTFQDTLSNKSKTLVGNYDHTQGFDGFAIECVRFFDRYLKGIENGIDEEPPFYLYTTGSDTWNLYEEWPLADEEMTPWYFEAGGTLSDSAPAEEGSEEYTVDYTTSSGPQTRWLAMTGDPSEYEDRAAEDDKCLTFTTAPLQADLEVTGHPVLHLYVSTTAADGDFFVYLEDVGADGYAQYKSEGQLRASLRKLGQRPWLPDLPYHPSFQADVQELVPGETVELVIALFPVSHVFKEGHSVRVSLAGADVENFRTPELSPAPVWTVSVGGTDASYIDMPIIP